MTEPTPRWIDWPSFTEAFTQRKNLPPKEFDRALKPLAADRIVTLIHQASPILKHLTIPVAGTSLRAALGEHRDGDLVVWQAGVGLSPISTHWGVKGLVNIWGASFREGLNVWLETLNGQRGQLLRQALQEQAQRQVFLDALLALPAAFHPQLSVGADVAARPELRRDFPRVQARKTPERNPFKDTDITPQNIPLLTRLLELYAGQSGKQTLLSVKLVAPPDLLERPEWQVVPVVQELLQALDQLAATWSAVSLHAAAPSPSAAPPRPLPVPAQHLLDATRFTRNVVLFGPPGTGKTHALQAFEHAFVQQEAPGPDLDQLTRWQVMALTLYHAGLDESFNVSDLIERQPLAQYETRRTSNNSYATVMTELIGRGADPSGQPVNARYQRSPTVFMKLPARTWTLSDEGRAYVETHLLSASPADWTAGPEERRAFVTFHPSFSYEEFVEGLRPVTDEDGHLTYPVRSGIFKRICQAAEQELQAATAEGRPARPYLLVIDEINRANIAKVFGELMTLLEDDKRVTATGGGYRVTLPYSGDTFGVPENLYVVATMNTADRSIALLDLALRRRFTFIEVLPEPDVIRQTSGDRGVVDGIDVADLLSSLNARLRVMLDRDHQLGHSYLAGITQGLDELKFRWYRKVIPLLQEYFYNDGQKLAELLGQTFIRLGQRTGGHGGRMDYDVVELDGPAFRSALHLLTPSAVHSSSAVPSEQV